MSKRTGFPNVFWAANSIEIFERYAYYGIYMGFYIYAAHLSFEEKQIGVIQSVFLTASYLIPVIAGTFADKYGFKKVLIISYLIYLPSILLLTITKTYPGVLLTMLCIGIAAGIFKPLISGTIRVVTDKTNKTLGFGIFYMMVNIGGSLGPVISAHLRAISWETAYKVTAGAIIVMLLITIFFYKEPKRDIKGLTLSKKMKDIGIALSDMRFLFFLILLGIFFWTPFWAFFNILPKYVNDILDTSQLYYSIKNVLGNGIANFLSKPDDEGVRHIMGESISHTGYIIIVLQLFVSRIAEKFRAIPTFLIGLVIAVLGFLFLGYANLGNSSFVFLGILLFAVGEMISSPRIQEYITWLAPKEKAGLYMGANFLAIGLGGLLSGITYTTLFGRFIKLSQPENIWYTLAGHLILGIIIIYIYMKYVGSFRELEK